VHVENGWRGVSTTALADCERILGIRADMKGMRPATGAWEVWVSTTYGAC